MIYDHLILNTYAYMKRKDAYEAKQVILRYVIRYVIRLIINIGNAYNKHNTYTL